MVVSSMQKYFEKAVDLSAKQCVVPSVGDLHP